VLSLLHCSIGRYLQGICTMSGKQFSGLLRHSLRILSVFPPLVALCLVSLSSAALAQVAQPLPALGLSGKGLTVSGLSSGGYMAAQFEVAYAKSVSGAAIIAGGPYGCSMGSAATASLTCSCPYEASDVTSPLGLSSALMRYNCMHMPPRMLADRSKKAIAGNKGHVDAQRYLKRHRVWLYSGDADPVVDPSIVDGLQQFYALAKVPKRKLMRVKGAHAGHGMPVAGQRNCDATRSPYLNGCAIDGAGELIKWLYRKPKLQAAQADSGSLHPFDQTPYRQAGVFDGLDQTGWVYVPKACELAGAHCKVHVVFHGCEQAQNFQVNGQAFGTQFVEQAGYNRWAEAAGVVVLYPQVLPSQGVPQGTAYAYNPKGCWDFWGYTSPGGDASLYSTQPPFARREAPQLRAVKAMVEALQAPAAKL
jgi:hypothetical protein